MIEHLNQRFGIEEKISFASGRGDLPKAVLRGPHSSAEIYLLGAHVTSFNVREWGEMLWMSEASTFQPDRPIRGGVPICWPWFGQPRAELPQHGFARTAMWNVIETKLHDDGNLEISLRLVDSEATRQLWPHAFELTMRVIAGLELTMHLSCLNSGDHPLRAEAALHTYFGVGEIADVVVEGLEGRQYIDKLDAMQVKPLSGSLQIDREVDRIFIDTADPVVVRDGGRQVEIRKSGSLSTVIWNPWIEKSVAMSDFPDDGYRSMLCVETTNAARDARTIQPGEVHTLTQSCRIGLSSGLRERPEAIL